MKSNDEIEKWIHIDTGYGDPWVLPIHSALNELKQKKQEILVEEKLNELSLWISIKLRILPVICKRLNYKISTLFGLVKTCGEKYIFTKEKNNEFAFTLRGDYQYLQYEILSDIDSLMFELNSVLELIGKFFKKIYLLIKLNSFDTKKIIIEIIKQTSMDNDWYTLLKKIRNEFIHESAPYIAVDCTNKKLELLIMKENIKSFEDKKKFIKLKEIQKIIDEFLSAKNKIQEHLIEIIRSKC